MNPALDLPFLMPEEHRLDRALRRIDELNRHDPREIVVHGERWPKELIHGRLVYAWASLFSTDPSDELLIAARGHHVTRWKIPRDSFSKDRSGYHRWRKACQKHHAEEVLLILKSEGFPAATQQRVRALLTKRIPRSDAEMQTLEDAMCLVFIETQLDDFVRANGETKSLNVLRKTLEKMSPEAIQAGLAIDTLTEKQRTWLERAVSLAD